MVKPLRPLKPPVAEQFGVIGRDDGARKRHSAAGAARLIAAALGEILGMTQHRLRSPIRIIKLLMIGFAGDAVILDAGVLANAGGILIRLEILLIQIIADVAVIFAIIVIGGVADAGAPYQFRGHRVATERSNAGRTINGSMDAERRRWLSMFNAVAVHQEIADARL